MATRIPLLFTLVALLLLPASASSVLRIEITEGAVGARPIAAVPFSWEGPGGQPEDIAAIIDQDLALSGQFSPVERGDLVARPTIGDDIRFSNWRVLGVDHVIVGSIEPRGDGYTVRFQLFDVLAQRQVTGYSFRASSEGLRRVAHEISDIVYEEITGERGAFSTRIAYVSVDTQDGDERDYSLQVSDYDGHNPRSIVISGEPILSPAWSPDGRWLAYVSYEQDRRPAVYVHEVATGERRRVSARAGINSAPAWSPDGRQLALSLSFEGSPSLYVLDLERDRLRRLTHGGAIDTSPVWTPDGDIIFASDRAGTLQVYRLDPREGRAQRLTFDGRYNGAPDISPDGSRVAFIHRTDDGDYRVAVQDLDSGMMRVLTDGRSDEAVSFAPNGRMILYSTRHQGREVLGAVSVDGRTSVRLAQARGNVREPVWSPFPQ